ncbi:hypothetical protein L7F22_009613 [Adiantum nelumboides]|nr:hypothetical protein [Adiantum nelumboides]
MAEKAPLIIMTPLKSHSKPNLALAITTTVVLMLINLSLAIANNLESYHSESMFKRAMVQAGVGNNVPSSSGSISHAATVGHSTFDNASAGGMLSKWPNGQDGKPKNLQEHHANQRALYERPPGGLPTEPFPYNPHPFTATTPSPAPSPGPSGNPKKQGRNLLRYTDEGQPKPLKSPPASGPTGSRAPSSKSLVPSPAPAPSPERGIGRMPDEPLPGKPPPIGAKGRQLSGSGKSRLRQKKGPITKRSLVPGGGNALSGGGSGGVNFSGTNAHSTSETSQSGQFGRWPDGNVGRPLHPKERQLFYPYVEPPGSPYHISMGPDPKVHFHTGSNSPSPSPAPSSNPKKQGRKLLRYTDEGQPKPLKSPPASGPTGSRGSSSSLSPGPAPAPGPTHGRPRIPDEPFPPPSSEGSGRKLSESSRGKNRLRNKH